MVPFFFKTKTKNKNKNKNKNKQDNVTLFDSLEEKQERGGHLSGSHKAL
jgi:hypothetical protein